MFLLDTNVVSELRRASRADSNVLAWASTLPSAGVYISSITVLELELGVQQIARRDEAQGELLRSWLEGQVLQQFEGRILAVDTRVARRCARLHVPDPQSERDALIAATALVHSMTVVTRNVQDFKASGVLLFNPWTTTSAP